MKKFIIKMPYNYIPPMFDKIKDLSVFHDAVKLLGIEMDYWRMRDTDDSDKVEVRPYVITDGMNGEFTFIGYILQANYIEDTHGGKYWSKSFRDDKWLATYAKEQLEIAFGIIGEPQIIELEIYQ